MYEIWVRIGKYGTPFPYTSASKITIARDDPIINECFNMYLNELKRKGLEVKEPAWVVAVNEMGEKRIDIALQEDKGGPKDVG